MTNKTFPKGIWMRVFMAPENLNKAKYKKAVAVFSFGVTMFECCQLQRPAPVRQVVGNGLSDPQNDTEAENLGCFSIDSFCGFLPKRFPDTILPPPTRVRPALN